MNFCQQLRVLGLHLVHRAQGDFSNRFLVKKVHLIGHQIQYMMSSRLLWQNTGAE